MSERSGLTVSAPPSFFILPFHFSDFGELAAIDTNIRYCVASCVVSAYIMSNANGGGRSRCIYVDFGSELMQGCLCQIEESVVEIASVLAYY